MDTFTKVERYKYNVFFTFIQFVPVTDIYFLIGRPTAKEDVIEFFKYKEM